MGGENFYKVEIYIMNITKTNNLTTVKRKSYAQRPFLVIVSSEEH